MRVVLQVVMEVPDSWGNKEVVRESVASDMQSHLQVFTEIGDYTATSVAVELLSITED